MPLGLFAHGGFRNAEGTWLLSRFDPYGKPTYASVTVANPWGFAGGYTDPTGLILFGDRYYDPSLGRFTQLEPSSMVPDFTYAGDNPISFSDPSGNVLVCECGGDSGSTSGGGGGGGWIRPAFFRPLLPQRTSGTPSQNPGRPQTFPQTVPSDAVFGKKQPEPPRPKSGYVRPAVGWLLILAGAGIAYFCYDPEYAPQRDSTGTGLYPNTGQSSASKSRRYDRLVQHGCLSPPPAP